MHLHFIYKQCIVCSPSHKKWADQISCLCHSQADTLSISEGFVSFDFSIFINIRLFLCMQHAVSILHKLVFTFSLHSGSFLHSFSPAGREESVPGQSLSSQHPGTCLLLPLHMLGFVILLALFVLSSWRSQQLPAPGSFIVHYIPNFWYMQPCLEFGIDNSVGQSHKQFSQSCRCNALDDE